MAKDFAAVNVSIWGDADFRALPAPAQHLYLLLWTSPGLSYCGVHDWRPGRIAALSDGLTSKDVRVIADSLAARHFVVIDDDTEELLVRSWMRFDGIMKKPRMAISCVSAYAEVASSTLRGVIVHELHKIQSLEPTWPSWVDDRVKKVLSEPSVDPKICPTPEDPFRDGFAYGFAQGFEDGLGQTLASVCLPPTPAPAPEPRTLLPGVRADKPGRKRPARRIPDGWEPNDGHREQARAGSLDLNGEAFRFRNHAIANDRSLVDWDAGFRNWLSKAKPVQGRVDGDQRPEGW